MKKTTRIISALLCLLMAATMFAGCKSKNQAENKDPVTDVTSVAPPKVEIERADEYSIADGTSIVTVITDNETGTTTMKVATGTTLGAFLEIVKAADGYSVKISDTSGTEVTDTAAIIENGFTFAVYKDGEQVSVISHPIAVVSEEEIKEAISEAESEAARVESETAIQQSQIHANEQNNQGTNSTISVIGPSGPNNSGDHGIDNTAPTDDNRPKDSILSGYNFEWLSILDEDRVGTTENAMLYKDKINSINSKYGMTTTLKFDANNTDASNIANVIMSGQKYADVVETTNYVVRSLAKQGLLCDIFSSSTFNRSDALYDNGYTRGVTFGGKAYGVSFSGMNTGLNGVTFNRDLISMYAPDYDIYSLYKNNQWTVEAYTEIMKLCTRNLDSNPNTYELYGVTSNTNIIGIALSSFAGSTAYRDTADNFIKPGFITDEGIASLNWCKEMFNNKYWKYIADISSAGNFFATGSCASIVTGSDAVLSASMLADFEIGFVPFPISGDQSKYITGGYVGVMFCVPITNQSNLDKVGLYLNELSSLSDSLINNSVKRYHNAGLDDVGVASIRWAISNTDEEYSSTIFSAAVSTAIDTSVTTASKNPASEMAKIAVLSQSELDDYYGILTGQGK